jgi:hypothetical protein
MKQYRPAQRTRAPSTNRIREPYLHQLGLQRDRRICTWNRVILQLQNCCYLRELHDDACAADAALLIISFAAVIAMPGDLHCAVAVSLRLFPAWCNNNSLHLLLSPHAPSVPRALFCSYPSAEVSRGRLVVV